jgi:hypothetical protein
MYRLEGFNSSDTTHGCDAERYVDTLKEARREARYMLSDSYRRAREAKAPLARVLIFRDPGECVDDISADAVRVG